jgi:phenylalanyl-tRNA synthetase beta subunit
VTRDLSLVLPGEVTYGRVVETLGSIEAPVPAQFEALDRYDGPPLAEGETALTIRVTLVPLERTLTDDETELYRQALVERLEQELGVHLRG